MWLHVHCGLAAMKLKKCNQQSVLVIVAKCRQPQTQSCSPSAADALVISACFLAAYPKHSSHDSEDAVYDSLCLAHCEAECKTANSALTSSSACSELSRLRLKLSSLATSLFSFLTVLISAAFSLPSRCACSSDVLAYNKPQEPM